MFTRQAVFPIKGYPSAESARIVRGRYSSAAAVACACLGVFGRIDKTEEFHITS
jgi:hypothetical protein